MRTIPKHDRNPRDNPPQMAPPPKYTETQITAAVAAVLDEHITQSEAIRRAAAGTLAPGLEPYQLSRDALSRAKLKAELDRARTAASADPRNAANNFARNVLAALQPSNRALLARLEKGQDVESRLRERAKTLREYVALQGATEAKQAQKTPQTPMPHTTPNLAALLAQHDTTPRDTPRDTSPARSDASSTGDDGASSHG